MNISVLPRISDHNSVLATFDIKTPVTESAQRRVWDFNKADWRAIKKELSDQDWSWMKQAVRMRLLNLFLL